MKALMLAAGVGSRLFGDDRSQPPKALIRFDGKTLLRRHIEILRDNGVGEIVLVVGYRKEEVMAEARAHAPKGHVRAVENPMFRGGPIISLWSARRVLAEGDPVLFMDADVLYHPDLIRCLVGSPHENCMLLDRDIEAGEDPVRICVRNGVPVDFGKRVVGDFDFVGEWPGFMKLSPRMAKLLAQATENYIESGSLMVTYEEAMRDVLVGEPAGTFGFEDITGVPWIEIDFPKDLERAEKEILPILRATAAAPFPSERAPSSNIVRPRAFKR